MLVDSDKRLNLTEVLELMGISRSRWYAGIASQAYPAPIKDGRRSTWPASQIIQLVQTGTYRRSRSQTPWHQSRNRPSL